MVSTRTTGYGIFKVQMDKFGKESKHSLDYMENLAITVCNNNPLNMNPFDLLYIRDYLHNAGSTHAIMATLNTFVISLC